MLVHHCSCERVTVEEKSISRKDDCTGTAGLSLLRDEGLSVEDRVVEVDEREILR